MSVTPLITEATQDYNPYLAEYDRGWTAAADEFSGEYRRGFTDALLIAFVFFTLGCALVATLVAVTA